MNSNITEIAFAIENAKNPFKITDLLQATIYVDAVEDAKTVY